MMLLVKQGGNAHIVTALTTILTCNWHVKIFSVLILIIFLWFWLHPEPGAPQVHLKKTEPWGSGSGSEYVCTGPQGAVQVPQKGPNLNRTGPWPVYLQAYLSCAIIPLLYNFNQFGRHASQRALHVTFNPGFNFFSIYLIFFFEKKKKKWQIDLIATVVDALKRRHPYYHVEQIVHKIKY